MKTIFFIGAPGSGKGSRGETCERELGFKRIITGELVRALGFNLSNVEDSFVAALVKDAIQKTNGNIIFDGFPRSIPQAEELDKLGVKVDKIIYFNISQEEAVKRIANRRICPKCKATYSLTYSKARPKKEGICDLCGEKLIQRADDNENAIRKKFKTFEEKTFALLDFYKAKGVEIRIFNSEIDEDSKILEIV